VNGSLDFGAEKTMFEEAYEQFDFEKALAQRAENRLFIKATLDSDEDRIPIGKYHWDIKSFFLENLLPKSKIEDAVNFAPFLSTPFPHELDPFSYEVTLIPEQGALMLDKYIERLFSGTKNSPTGDLFFGFEEPIFVVAMPPDSVFGEHNLLCFGSESMEYQCLGVIAADEELNVAKDVRNTFDYGLARPMAGTFSNGRLFVEIDTVTIAGIDVEHENPYRDFMDHEAIMGCIEDLNNSHWGDFEKTLRPRTLGDPKSPSVPLPVDVLDELRSFCAANDYWYSFIEEEDSYLSHMGYGLYLAEFENQVFGYLGPVNQPLGPFEGEGGESLLKNLRDLPGNAIARATSYEICLDPSDPKLTVYSGRKSPRKIAGAQRVY